MNLSNVKKVFYCLSAIAILLSQAMLPLIAQARIATIVDKSITVTAPRVGEVWRLGETRAIKWQSYSTAERTNDLVKITLDFPLPDCVYQNPRCLVAQVAPYVIGESAPNSGVYEWTIPVDLAEVYQGSNKYIAIINLSDGYSGKSDIFTVGSSYPVNRPPVITSVSGPTSLEVNEAGTWGIKAYDPDGNYLTYSVDWGEQGDTAPKLNQPTSERVIQETTFSHQFSSGGTYKISFMVTDDKGASTQSTITVTVGGGSVVINQWPQLNPSVVPYDGKVGVPVSFYFSASDPDNDNLTWTVNWGDGQSEGGTCPSSLPNTSFYPVHTWSKVGTYVVKVQVSDCRGGSAETSFVFTVLPTDNNYEKNISSPYLFALDVQADQEGVVNYDIYAAFNRVIQSSYRAGKGVRGLIFT